MRLFISIVILGLFIFLPKTISAQAHKKSYEFALKSYKYTQFEEAIKYCDEAIAKKPKYADAYLLKGKCLLELNRYHDALDQFYVANNLLPQESEYCFYKGYCEWKLKRYSKAILTLEQAIEFSPDNLLAYMYIGTLYYELKMYTHASQYFNKALDVDPTLSVNMFVKERFLKFYNEAYAISMDVSNSSLIRKGNKADELFLRALLKSMVGDNSAAYEDINAAIKINPNASIFYFYRGYIAYGIRKLDNSLEDLQKYIALHPKDDLAKEMSMNINSIMSLSLAIQKD